MSRWTGIAAGLLLLAGLAGPASAGTLETTGGVAYTGVVVRIDDTDVTFLWQQDKDQPDSVKKNQDLLFDAQGHEALMRTVPVNTIVKIDGIPPEVYRTLHHANLFVRVFTDLDTTRVRVASAGDFVRQIKGVGLFLAFLLVLVPLALVVVSLVLPGERMGFFYAAGMVLVLTAIGWGASALSGVLATSVAAMASTGVQAGLSALIVIVVALLVHAVTRYSFWQGLAFTAVWAGALFASGRILMALMGGTGA